MDILSWLTAALAAAFPDGSMSGGRDEMVFDLGDEWDRTAAVPAPTDERVAALITGFSDGSLSMSGGEWFGKLMISMASNIVGDAANYVEMGFHDPDSGHRWTVCVQRPTGITPHQARELAERRADDAEHRLAVAEARIAELSGGRP